MLSFVKNLKNRHFVVGGSKNLKLSTNICFGVSFQKNLLPIFLLFSSVCFQDDLSNSKRNEIASSTALTSTIVDSYMSIFHKKNKPYISKYLTDSKLKMSGVFIFGIKRAKKGKTSNF